MRTGAIVALGEITRAGEADVDRLARRALLGFANEGQPLERRFALPLAGGALAGAAIGVQLVHVDAIAALGQVLLGATLWFSAVRFGLDAWRGDQA